MICKVMGFFFNIYLYALIEKNDIASGSLKERDCI